MILEMTTWLHGKPRPLIHSAILRQDHPSAAFARTSLSRSGGTALGRMVVMFRVRPFRYADDSPGEWTAASREESAGRRGKWRRDRHVVC